MSYRLINANNITFNSDGFITAKNIEKMPCIYADLPNGMDGEHYVLEQEPCEDCISRQAVIDSIRNYFHDEYYQRTSIQDCRDCLIEDVIKPLPSDTPQTKTGHWIRFKEFENGYYHIKCSECGQYWSVDGHAKIFRYCFNCGAKMEEVDL